MANPGTMFDFALGYLAKDILNIAFLFPLKIPVYGCYSFETKST
jgi:hypothetical protein